jgi:N-6 DNA Methylase/TaqI-like C-terminal specificity domain
METSTLKRATKIAESLKAIRPRPGSRWTAHRDLALARALFWESEQLERRAINRPSLESLTRVNVGGQGAAVFGFSKETSTKELVNIVAFYAYHASIEWCLVGNEEELTILNSHWVRRGSWFELPPVKWERIDGALDIFEALTPEGLTYGQIERVAARFPQPDKLLLPVDDALVSRLDFWRSEIARYSPDVKRADELIHKLFAQLFVLRAVEDRRLTEGLSSLLNCCEDWKRTVDREGLKQIFIFARTHLQSELFQADIIDDIPDPVVAGVIRDLYFPVHLPIENARYNFSWIDADVLGRAYEKYLSQVLQSSTTAPQLELLHNQQPVREVDRLRTRKGTGIYYTPQFLVSYLVKECIDRYMSESDGKTPRVVDPSCGSGSFLTASVSYLIQKLRGSDSRKNWGRELVSKKMVCGIDSDARAVLLARLSLWLRLTEEPHPLPLPALDEIIIEGNSLSVQTWENLPSEFDIVLGNPPFAPTGSIASRTQLETEFVTARGRFDYAYLFIESGVKKLRANGHLGMVIPNRLFRNRDAGPAREFLANNTTVELVTDFGSNEVFRGVSAYIGTIVVAKRKASYSESMVRFTRVVSISPRLMNLVLSAASHKEMANDIVESFDIQHPSGAAPWVFLSPSARSARLRLEGRSVLLSELADVFQGIKTGANDLYIVQVESEPSAPVVSIRNGLGDAHMVESDLLHPVVYGAQVEAYRRVMAGSFIIYPYLDGVVIEEAKLSASYPLTYKYLRSYRSLLESRTSVAASGRKWFELIRHRDQSKLQRAKLLMRDLATTTAFALDDIGSTFLVGGTAVVPNDSAILKPLLAYLNSVLINWYLAPMTPSFRSEFQKFEPQHLSNIPVLSDVVEDEGTQQELTGFVDAAIAAQESANTGAYDDARRGIDRVVCSIVGIDPNV